MKLLKEKKICKLSIVVSIYNVESYLEKCIQSLVNQNLEEYEILLINDGSTDKSEEICNKYSSKFENVILHNKINGGLSSARNYGLNKAKGKYIYFVDGDDYLEKNILKQVINTLEKNNLDILQINYREERNGIIDQENKIQSINNCVLDGKEWLKNENFIPMAWIYIYNKEYLIANNLLFLEGIYHEDTEFNPRAIYHSNRIMNKNIYVYNYVIRENSIMTSKNIKKSKDMIKIGHILKAFKEEVTDEKICEFFKKRIEFSYASGIKSCIVSKFYLDDIFENKKEKKYVTDILIKSKKIKYKLIGIFLKTNLYKIFELIN